jgi:hypothetical protein
MFCNYTDFIIKCYRNNNNINIYSKNVFVLIVFKQRRVVVVGVGMFHRPLITDLIIDLHVQLVVLNMQHITKEDVH